MKKTRSEIVTAAVACASKSGVDDLAKIVSSLGMTAKELSEATGVSQVTISKVVRGADDLGLGRICELAVALGAEVKIVVSQGANTINTQVNITKPEEQQASLFIAHDGTGEYQYAD